MQFFTKSKYHKRDDGKLWNRAGVVRAIADEMPSVPLTAEKDKLLFASEKNLQVLFIVTQPPTDPGILDLNASILFSANGEDMLWADLVSLAKVTYGKNYRALRIRLDEAWEGSAIQKETKEVYAPLFAVFSDEALRNKYLSGQEVVWNGTVVQLPQTDEYEWLRENSNALAFKLK